MLISLTTEPMAHQLAAVERIAPSRVGGLFMDMGTGKSLTAMMLAARRAHRIDKVWWGCPCSLRQTIVEQITMHSTSAGEDVHVLTSKSTDAEIERASWIVFGIESVGQSDAVTLKLARHVKERSMMVVDESTFIKGSRAQRTRRLTTIGAVCRYRLVMTGTPLTQGIVDLYAQMRFLSEKILGYASFWSFAQAHLVYRYEKIRGRDGKKREVKTDHVIGYMDIEPVIENISPYVYQVTKAECLDLPDKIYANWRFDMSDEQQAAYDEAKQRFILDRDVDDFFGPSSTFLLFRLFTALQTITAGIHEVDGKPVRHDRIATMLAFMDQIPVVEPVVVFTKFRKCADQIGTALDKAYGPGSSTIFDGRHIDRVKQGNLRGWREGRHRFLLATQESGGRGLTLNESCWSLFYADSFKYDNRLQGEDRMHRIGQERRPTYGSIVCNGSIDVRIEDNLHSKGVTLKDFRRRLDAEKRSNVKERLLEFVGG